MARRSTSVGAGPAQLGIRSRLLLLLAVPLTGLLLVTGFAMNSAVRQSRDAARLRSTAEVSLASYRLVDALQAERKVLAAGEATNARLRDDIVSAAGELRHLSDQQDGQQDSRLRLATQRALDRVDAAGSLAATNTGGLVAVDGYSPAIASLLSVSRSGFDPGEAMDSSTATTVDLLASAQEAAAKERDLIRALAIRGQLDPAVYGQVSELAAAQDIQASQAVASADPSLTARIDRAADAVAAASLGRDRLFLGGIDTASTDGASTDGASTDGASTDGTSTGVADVDAWLADATTRVAAFHDLRGDAAAIAVNAIDGLAASSRTLALASFASLLAAALISAFLVRSAIRSIARPLQELAHQAEDVALVRLPEAVKGQQSGSGDGRLPTIRAAGATEVREVAGAFNDVQDTALRLAGEQAVLRRNLAEALTNLGRRNQALLGRQLDFISSLEQRETDPAFLEHLFKLDHLASRMRRNAESLLILTGSETPRRRRKPAPLNEVVRAAMSEVEDFERVRLGRLGDVTLTGPVVIDLVHMLAELIENSLRFSPPDTTVEIDGRSLGQGGYQLAVIDHGVGMADVEILAANQRLAGLDEVDGMPTRYLGQYVIAKLAAKTGALVRLQPTAGGRGITAVVSLPASATVGGADRSSIARPLPGSLAARDQGAERIAPGAGLTARVAQPETVIDPDADPFAEEVPTREELAPADIVASEEWGWVPESVEPSPEAEGVAGTWADDWESIAPASDADAHEEMPAGPETVDLGDVIGAGSYIDTSSRAVDDVSEALPEVGTAERSGLSFVGDVTFERRLDTPAVDTPALDTPALDTPAVDTPPIWQVADGADRAAGTDAEELAAGLFAAELLATPPPPPPDEVPDQGSWTGLPDPSHDGSQPVLGAPPVVPTDPWAHPSQARGQLHPQPEAAMFQPEAPRFGPDAGLPDSGLGSGLGGGLTRRVPGASLQESPLARPVPEAPVAQERSADGVRSMLSAFQGGRSRGREGAVPDTDGFLSATYDNESATAAPEL